MIKKRELTLETVLPWLYVIGGFICLFAAFILTMEKMALLKDASYQPSCNLNPVLSCGSIIRTPQASAFGFPNPFIGLAGFAVVITTGMAMLAGAKFKRWYWRGMQLGVLFGIVFVHWLIFESLYDIGALCMFCMVVWSIVWPTFWYTSLYNLRVGHIPTPKKLTNIVSFAQKHHFDILVVWYVIIIFMITQNFWYYWKTII